ncbi:hypothetical protein SDC9_160393 [bioreactor metagenome]|uniref:Uncharacterized protein n=1 Tax=bioreactor metagenome TaxID=1076179 RepID=A0A645FLJ5_9ZZZZ
MTGAATKVTEVPSQMVSPGIAAMLTEAATEEFTDIVIAFDVAVAPTAQVAFEMTVQVTTSPLLRVLLVNVELFGPVAVPLTDHE